MPRSRRLPRCRPEARPGQPPVPALIFEPVPVAPSTRVIWQPGHWHWNGARFVWVRGHFVQRLAYYHQWVPGHWDGYGHWIRAHWG